MRVPTGSGQDETSEPESWTEWREDVQINVSMIIIFNSKFKKRTNHSDSK